MVIAKDLKNYRDYMTDELNKIKLSGDYKIDFNITSKIKKSRVPNDENGSGAVMINIVITEKDKSTNLLLTVYAIASGKAYSTFFVNDLSHDIVFNNYAENSLEKSKMYVLKYINGSIKRICESSNTYNK